MSHNAFASAALPDHYTFVSKTEINPTEIMSLRKSVNWKSDTAERWQQCLDQSLVTIGVRDAGGVLIGMASLTGNVRHAVICDLAVNPNHHRRGIGAAIMNELMMTTHERGVSYVYAELAKTNPFREQMIQSGFVDTGDSLFMDISDL
jgi:ribosomal protein S18 acetylase RimI-like enzyme